MIRVTKVPALSVIKTAFENKIPVRIKVLFPGTSESVPFTVFLEEQPKFDAADKHVNDKKRESVSIDLKVRFESGLHQITTDVTYKLEYRPFKTNRSMLYLRE